MADPRKIIQLATSVPKMLEELSRVSAKTKSLSAAEREANFQQFLEVSKAKDRLYHATRATEGGKGVEALRTLKPSKDGSLGSGVYLTPSTAHASTYSGLPNDEAIEMMRSFAPDMAKQVLDSREQRKILDSQVGGNMLPVHAQIRNPLIIEGAGDPMVEALIKLGMDEVKASKMVERAYEDKGYIGKQVQSRAQAAGYDGLMQYRNGELSEVVPFRSNQVKSAIGNEGTYDINSPELSKKKGGVIDQTIEQAKRKSTPQAQYNPQRVRTPSQFERDFDQYRANISGSRGVLDNVPERLARSLVGAPAAVAGYAAQIPGTVGDLRELYDEIKPEGYPNAPDWLKRTLTTDQIQELFLPENASPELRAGLAGGNAAAIAEGVASLPGMVKGAAKLAASGAKNLAPTAAKFAEDYLMRTGQMLPVIKPPSGNWVQGNVENSMKGLRSRGPTEFDREWLIRHANQDPRASERGLQAIPQNEAINQFVDKQLTRYVKNEMGTPGDPIRLAADAFPEQKAKLLFDKQKQIDKATADMEKARVARGFTPEMMTRSQARIRELEKERELIELRTGLHYEPQSAEVASDQARRAAGYPPDPVSTTPYGQAWENISDRAIESAPYRMRLPMVTAETAPDALRALGGEFAVQNPNAMAYSVLGGEFNDVLMRGNLGFGHIIDELRNATHLESGLPKELLIDPKNLSKWTVQQSVEHVDKINAWRAAQKAEADLIRANNAATVMYKDYPDKGMKWVELKMPDKAPEGWVEDVTAGGKANLDPNYAYGQKTLADALKYEGEQLQHCVGGYCPDVISGKSRIFSLRDAKGKPHATVEVKPPQDVSEELQYKYKDKINNKLMDYLIDNPDADRDVALNHVLSQLKEELPSSIVQIKGMNDRIPKEEYLPYVQDFVRSQQWSDVGDLHHTGLYKTEHDTAYSHNILPKLGENGAYDRARAAGEIQPYMTKVEIEAAMKKHAQDDNILPPSKPMTEADIDGPWEPEDMKRGGPVNQDAMQMAVWNKAIRKQVGGDLTQAEIDAATLPARMNPNLAAQGQRYARSSDGFLRDPQSYKDMAGNLLEMISPPVPTPEEARAGLGSMRADRQLKGSVMQGYPDAQSLLADQAYDKMGNIAMAGMNVYHGSPHRFPPTAKNPLGEFDPTKIGTGEGAQAYGVGAGYLAEVKDLAKGYAESLSRAQGNPLVVRKDGKIFKEGDQLTSDILDGLKYLEVGKKNAGQFPHNTQYYARIAAEKIPNDAYRARVMNAIDELEGTTHAYEKTKGYLYKVDLPDEQIAKMLDWDKPLSQQPKEVQKALAGIDKDMYSPKGSDYDPAELGQQTYQRLIRMFGDSKTSAVLAGKGIPGIRYLDAGSRHLSNWEVGKANPEGTKWVLKNNEMASSLWKTFNTKAEADAALKIADPMAGGTRNFVVFDPAHMNIVSREKKGGLVNQDAMNIAVWDKAIRKAGGGRMNAAEMALNLIKKGAKAVDVSNELKASAAARTAAGVPDLPPAMKTGVKAGNMQSILEGKIPPMTAPKGTGLPLLPRSQGMYTQGVAQEDLPRQKGRGGKYTERMQDLLDSRSVKRKTDDLIKKGDDLGMREWYGTEPLRIAAMDMGVPPEDFARFMAHMSSASQRNPVDKQNQMGSLLWYLENQGKLTPESVLLTNKLKKTGVQEGTSPVEFPTGYGSLAQSAIFERAKQIAAGDIEGALPPERKLGTFYRNLLGNLRPVTVDVNAVRGPIITHGDPRWLESQLVEKDELGEVIAKYRPREAVASGEMSLKEAKERPGFWLAAPEGSEYAGFEKLWQQAAKRAGVSPAEAQAMGWYGSADVTALKTKPELYVDNLERLIRRTAEQTGKSQTEVLSDMFTGRGFLYKKGGKVQKKAAGGMTSDDLILEERKF